MITVIGVGQDKNKQNLILKMYYEGAKIRDIADSLSLSTTGPVLKFLKTLNLKGRNRGLTARKWTNDQLNNMYKMYYTDDKTLYDIGDLYKVSNVTIKNIFVAKGWERRNNKGDQNPSRRAKLVKLKTMYLERGCILCDIYTYQATVKYVSKKVALLNLDVTNPLKKNINTSHLDHLLSIYDSYYNTFYLEELISIKEICHPCNLIFVNKRDNLVKNRRSELTPEELRKDIKWFNKNHGDPFKDLKFNFEEWEYKRLKPNEWSTISKVKFRLERQNM